MRWIIAVVAAVALTAAACGGDDGDTTEPATANGQEKPAPLSIDEIAQADASAITFDLSNYPSSVHARYVHAVYNEVGLHTPLGLTDKSLILYGLAACESDSPALPTEWEPVRGDTQADVEMYAEAARDVAHEMLCP